MIVNYQSIDLFGKPVFTRADVKTPFRITAAMPDDEACFSYLLSGRSFIYSEKEKLHIKAKQAFLSKCGTYITHMLSDQTDGRFSSVTVHFRKEILEKIYEGSVPSFLKEHKSPSKRNSVHVAASGLIKQYFQGLIHYFKHRELITDEIIILKLKEIILLLLQTENAEHVQEIMHGLFSPHTLNFKEIVERHICSSLSIQELASLCHLSSSSFKRKFRKIYDESPGNYLMRKRTEQVANLLRVSDETITQIAYACGFRSISHLSKAFKKRYGVSPSTYRVNKNHQ